MKGMGEVIGSGNGGATSQSQHDYNRAASKSWLTRLQTTVTTVGWLRQAGLRGHVVVTRDHPSLINPPSLHNGYFPCSCSFQDKVHV